MQVEGQHGLSLLRPMATGARGIPSSANAGTISQGAMLAYSGLLQMFINIITKKIEKTVDIFG